MFLKWLLLVSYTMCDIHNEEFSEEWLEGVESQESESTSAAPTPTQPQNTAVGVRDALMSLNRLRLKTYCHYLHHDTRC